MQLQNVVGQTNQRPFHLNFLKPAQHKLPKSAHLLDLPEYRLHNRFAHRVDPSPDLGVKLALHPLYPTGSLRQRPSLANQPIASVLLPLGSHISINLLALPDTSDSLQNSTRCRPKLPLASVLPAL